jgi:hypothetical protein
MSVILIVTIKLYRYQPLRNVYLNLKGQGSLNLKKIQSDWLGNHKLSIDTTQDPCKFSMDSTFKLVNNDI